MKRILYALAALLLLALGALLLAPATLVDGWLRERTQGRLSLTHSEGTVWNGDGEPSVTLPGGRVVVLPGVRWRVSPWSLFGGALEVTISGRSAASEPVRGSFRIERTATQVRNVELTIPADALAALALFATLAPSGEVSIEIELLRWSPPTSSGGGRVRWRQASLLLPEERARFGLGTADVQFVARGDSVAYTLRNDGGDVALEGNGEWRPGATPSLDATLRARPGTPEPLASALSRMAGGAGASMPLHFPALPPAAR